MGTEEAPRSGMASSLIGQFSEISRLLDESQSTLIIDPILARIANDAEARGDFGELKSAILWALHSGKAYASCEIVQFYGFRFRWPWLKKEIEDMLLDKAEKVDFRAMRAYELMLEAFDDNWEDRDLFPSLEA
ncbi:hypothetical protein ACGFZP_18930 [Kitasatospora sp. NPDC048239]|uniref:hypothetical protein n=1 Tax=Kitasatospora sp. NPDC048239 TaxID=3364046 RepID=UPI0037100769